MKNIESHDVSDLQARVQEFVVVRSLNKKIKIIEEIIEIYNSDLENTPSSLLKHFFNHIVDSNIPELRKSLAENIQFSHNVPLDIVLQLSQDAIDISKPILNHSPVLSTEHLITLLNQNISDEHNAEIIHGTNTTVELIDHIIEMQNVNLIQHVINNENLQICEDIYHLIIDNFNASKEILIAIASRKNITVSLKNELLSKMSEMHNANHSDNYIKSKKLIDND